MVREKEEHKVVYYISKVLQGEEMRYFIVEKFALTVIIIARKMKSYFQAYQVIVLTDQP